MASERRTDGGVGVNKAVVREFLAAHADDIERAIALLHPDLRWATAIMRGRPYDHDTFVRVNTQLFEAMRDGFHFTVESMVAEGDRVCVRTTGAAVTKDGVPYENDYSIEFVLEDGLIRNAFEYYDTALAAKVMGPIFASRG